MSEILSQEEVNALLGNIEADKDRWEEIKRIANDLRLKIDIPKPAMNKWIEAVELIKEAKYSLESARSLGLKMTALDIMGKATHKLEIALNILQKERE